MKRNNVNLERLKNTAAEASGDPAKARRTSRVEGTWNLEEGKPQFTATLTFDGRTQTLEADQPGFLGGGGTRPGPVLYCLYGTAACFAATFASMAAMEGVELRGLRVVAENDINLRPVLGLSQEPIVEKVRLRLTVSSPAPPVPDRRTGGPGHPALPRRILSYPAHPLGDLTRIPSGVTCDRGKPDRWFPPSVNSFSSRSLILCFCSWTSARAQKLCQRI
jgi:uncharacterized OsmC-like protein